MSAVTGEREPKIRLERLTKRYPGQAQPAVDELTLAVPEGEIVVLVGPSGCGKTTTMKMINRLIEPTSGRIMLEGDDVTKVNADRLRRRIGYVIQQIGLFPHLTIRENIATVPKLLGWSRERIDARVDELLATMGMDPEVYRQRYPKELSGGQRQRVGVARALSADPEVMLMDEPFGAIDPITRDRLQNEFLRIQEGIRKTILFVTHDIDEAIKMGDRIAILRQDSHIAQYDTPGAILACPADGFVSEFIGRGRVLKLLNLSRIRDIELSSWPTVPAETDAKRAFATLRDADKGVVLTLDDQRRPRRWLAAGDLQRAEERPLAELGIPVEAVLEPHSTLADALDEMLHANYNIVVVVDRGGVYQGIVDIGTINSAFRTLRAVDRRRTGHELEQAAGGPPT